jgi:hypothetical protein
VGGGPGGRLALGDPAAGWRSGSRGQLAGVGGCLRRCGGSLEADVGLLEADAVRRTRLRDWHGGPREIGWLANKSSDDAQLRRVKHANSG